MTALPLALLLAAVPARSAEMAGGPFSLSGGMSTGGQPVTGAVGLEGSVAEMTGGTDALLVAPGAMIGQSGNLDFGLLARAQANTVVAPGSGLRVTLQANAAPTDFDLFLNMDPVRTPQRVNAAVLQEALAKLQGAPGSPTGPIPQGLVEISLLRSDFQYLDGELAAPATLRLQYADADNDGFIDGANPPVKARSLRLWRLDEARRVWERVPGSVVDANAKELSATLLRFSVYAAIGVADVEVGSVYAFPVPWSPDGGNPAQGNAADGIRFTNLPTEGAIRIFTLKGELVRSLSIPPGTATLRWDVRADNGAEAASGVYWWMVEAGGNRKSGKLMVIR